jgi:hypothetical protein
MNRTFAAPILAAFVLLAFLALGASALHASLPDPSWPARGKGEQPQYAQFPVPVEHYQDAGKSVWERIRSRASQQPFNVVATLIFLCAVVHTFLAPTFLRWAHRIENRHRERIQSRPRPSGGQQMEGAVEEVSFKATVLEFLGEVEAVFALWGIPLLVCAWAFHDWGAITSYMNVDTSFTEPMFVVVIMAVAASRPVVQFAEGCLSRVAALGKGTPAAWWLTVLILAPLLGSFITEPAAMTISAMLLSRKFFELKPSRRFAYATLGLLFVNVSIGGVLTNFAAPPVLMVAGPDRWNLSTLHMLEHFGDRATLAIVVSTTLYFFCFRRELRALGSAAQAESRQDTLMRWVDRHDPVPGWITLTHLAFLAWTVVTSHYPPLFVGGFLFFMAFVQATGHHQNAISIRGPLLVGFFLAGLVLHGRMQGWWLEPILSSGINDWALHGGATVLTGFNDNALITFLASQVPHLDPGAKYAILSGAVAGGGLTVIANAPNPAGQALLKRYFGGAISPLPLFLAALAPTLLAILAFMATRF